MHLKREHNALLVAVHEPESDQYNVNPNQYEFKGGEHAIVISSEPVKIR